MARLAVAGLWHQGLVLAASLAALGHDVRGLADDAAAATALSGAVLPLYEPGLADLVRHGLEARRLRFTAEPGDAVTAAEFVFLSLDTPVGEDDRPVLQRVFDASDVSY